MWVESLCMIPHQTQRFCAKVVSVSSGNEDDFPCGRHEIGQTLPGKCDYSDFFFFFFSIFTAVVNL